MDGDDYDPRDDPDFREFDGGYQDNDFGSDYDVFEEAAYDDTRNWDIDVDRRDQINCRVYNAGGTKFLGECFSVSSLRRVLSFFTANGRLKVALSIDSAGEILHFRVGTDINKVLLRCL